MSNSTFNITEPDSNDSLTLIVSPNGTVTPDKETVRNYLSSRPTVDINLMRMRKVEAGSVNVTLDTLTYINSDEIEDQEEMDEIARNLMNLRRDHDYTPLTSPSHEKPNDPIEDELAQTLSMLEGGPLMRQEPLTKITKIVKGKKQTIFVNSKQKARMISTGLLKEKPSERLFKKPKAKVIEVVQKKEEVVEHKEEPAGNTFLDEEDNLVDNDDNDSDFEPEDVYNPLKPKPRTRTRSESIRRRIKQIKINKDKIEPEIQKTNDEPAEKPIPEPKPVEKKITPKKEKKAPKPIPDDFALFSTPDIIRRVKEPESPEKLSPPKPAKVHPPKILYGDLKMKRNSTETQRRPSTDNKPRPEISSTASSKIEDQVTVQEVLNTSSESINPEDQLQPMPSVEDIRAIIQNENTKSFTTSLVIPDIVPNAAEDQSGNAMNLDTGGLDLDQSLLDNINSDMISEDILYQVAQSLVGNTELQNVIDKSISEGNLVLDSSMQNESLSMPQQPQPPVTENIVQQIPTIATDVAQANVDETSKSGTQIIRPDGRVVIIPPIERPTTRSRNKKKDLSPVRQVKPVKKPLDEEHVSGNELDSEEEDEEESEDDPNKLWCICNQPHNNRFMICCDTCEEWYHGKCVNVTKAMGQMMEQEGKEWICIYCKDASLKRPKAAARRIRKASRTSTDSGGGGGSGPSSSKKPPFSTQSSTSSETSFTNDEKKQPSGSTQPGCVVCGKPSRNSSIYCSDTCILKHAQGVEKVVVFDRKNGKLLSGSNAPSAANLDKWLSENPTYEVVRSAVKQGPPKQATFTQTKLRLVKNPTNDGVSLAIHKKGINIGVLQHSPKETPEVLNSKQTPKKPGLNITGLKIISKQGQIPTKIKVVPASPITTRPMLTSTPTKLKMVQTKLPITPIIIKTDKQPMPQKTPKSRQAEVPTPPKQENLRETVKKTFFEQLFNRLKKVTDLKLTDAELKGISNEIESQLYKCFGDTGQKYKNKYRSLIFNIKDAKNQTLWRRICEKSVNPYQLVRLSPDDLASQELALWREREAKHQLDMIKKSEMELLNCNRQYVFKTHKGEQVFEDDNGNKDQVTEVISGLGNEKTEKEELVDNGKDKKNTSVKHNKKDRERGRSRESSKSRRDSKERHKESRSSSKKRSRSKDRSSTRHSERKRSRSRERHRRSSHRSSRHSKKEEKTINTEKLDKKSKEILEQLVDKNIVPPLEDRLWKHVTQEDIVPAPTVESDSDHEPSSTVTIPTPPRTTEPDETIIITKPEEDEGKTEENNETNEDVEPDSESSPDNKFTGSPIWTGSINMIDVAQISITAHEVSGDCQNLGEELPRSLDIVGRISPDTVWDYIGKMKSSNSKTISVIRLIATNMEERMPYLALYSYLSSRNRLGVVKTITKAVKDFYILPLAGSTPIPEPLLPITGPGFEDSRPALLLGVLVRDKRKRLHESGHHGHTKRVRVDIVSHSQQPSTPPSSSRSYTPPPTKDPRVKIPTVPLPVPLPLQSEPQEDDMDEPYSPEDSDPDTMPEQPLSNSRLNKNDLTSLLTGPVKSSSFLESGLSAQTFEPFTSKFDSIPGLDDSPSLSTSSIELQRKMAELDQRIAAQKAEIDKVSQDLVSSATSADIGSSTLANIALPSNLQQILESIKTIGSKTDGIESQGENSNSSLTGAASDLTIPLLLPKLSSRPLTGSATKLDTTIPLNLPKPKSKQPEAGKSGSVLSTLSEEDLIKKAAEMLGEAEDVDPPSKKPRIDLSQPPIPGLD